MKAIFPSFSGKKTKLLEFGCGVGALTRYIALNAPSSEITAIDINQELIDLAKIRSQEQHFKNIIFRQGDANLFKDLTEEFDGAYCRFLLEEFNDPVKVIKSMSQFVNSEGWVCVYERLNRYCRTYPHSDAITNVWNAIYEFYQKSYGANPNIAEELTVHFESAGLKNIKSQGFSRILSKEKNADLFSWYVEAALAVITQLKEQLLKDGKISYQTFDEAIGNYKNLLASPNSFILEVTVCVTGFR
ncbi:MAG: methyltransferase domain-containing protein [Bdellovibrionaceae bacterium]|nr:methyltransferase domain-containing protein [Pseudobdellovibrionaceae bacterium]